MLASTGQSIHGQRLRTLWRFYRGMLLGAGWLLAAGAMVGVKAQALELPAVEGPVIEGIAVEGTVTEGTISVEGSTAETAAETAAEIPEEILRTEIITGARSPLTGKPLSAVEYAQLQAELASPAGNTLVSEDLRYLIFLLQVRRSLKPILPFVR